MRVFIDVVGGDVGNECRWNFLDDKDNEKEIRSSSPAGQGPSREPNQSATKFPWSTFKVYAICERSSPNDDATLNNDILYQAG